MAFCENCRTTNHEDSYICSHCGYQLRDQPVMYSEEEESWLRSKVYQVFELVDPNLPFNGINISTRLLYLNALAELAVLFIISFSTWVFKDYVLIPVF